MKTSFILKSGDVVASLYDITGDSEDIRGKGEILYIDNNECHIKSYQTEKLHILDSKQYGKIGEYIHVPTTYPKNELDLLFKHGHNPIGFSVMMTELTFIFRTKEEAEKAHSQFELHGVYPNVIQGFWYDKEEFLLEREKYEELVGYKMNVTWLP